MQLIYELVTRVVGARLGSQVPMNLDSKRIGTSMTYTLSLWD